MSEPLRLFLVELLVTTAAVDAGRHHRMSCVDFIATEVGCANHLQLIRTLRAQATTSFATPNETSRSGDQFALLFGAFVHFLDFAA